MPVVTDAPTLQECLAESRQYTQTRLNELIASGQKYTFELHKQVEAEKIELARKHAARYSVGEVHGSDLLDLARLLAEADQFGQADAAIAARMAQKRLAPAERADALSLGLEFSMRVFSKEQLPPLEEIVSQIDKLQDGTRLQRFMAHGQLASYHRRVDSDEGYLLHMRSVLDLYPQLTTAERESDQTRMWLQGWLRSMDIGEEPAYSAAKALLQQASKVFAGDAKVLSALQKELDLFNRVGKPGASIEAVNWLNGKPKSALPQRGKATLLMFTAHWCGFCKSGYPVLNALHERFHQRGLDIACVTELYGRFGEEQNLSAEDEVERDRQYFVEQHGLPVHIAINVKKGGADQPSRPAEPNQQSYCINGYPSFVLLDTKQVVRRIIVGASPTLEATLTAAIGKMLSPKGATKAK